ncbi:hypothetical protein [Sphingobacterium mizutaii]|uniref:hypothetical protein n=1 Tax=Sphingobacterium mizutaii TaxID=1010 RepID=UPI003D98A4F1
MENLNINILAVLISISLGIAELINFLISAFSNFHIKHKINELAPIVEISEKTKSPNKNSYVNKMKEYLFLYLYKFSIRHDEIPVYTNYIIRNKLTPTQSKLLFKRKYFVIDKSKKSIRTIVSKPHKRYNLYNLIRGTFFCLLYMASISYAIFTPVEPNNYLPFFFVFVGFLFLVLSGIIFTHYVSPYNWAMAIQKNETKYRN